ncbi:MAG: PTS-dependent dihydroxyacetone kinase phosphotransferase subunit DhaM [Deltaproteobacteria bacterium]|nr:MAG: PTS-dependent dihydroxyacetone kinase phosphotransferase subunit DhaM [Deltaproteobacteria bacterium]TMB36544.1 MAG: PTS-dependent dihydroxyacetone kinase phosphotransferase subunit DhaM [Deltaproteobacteria bacterium]TMB39901.1 MAG: PTS-dependent dihydroxyacetone kinase phosphotransferase subunit DhaM [Deltaproteobacteria bacterium]
MTERVSIVIVSHSADVARGAAAMVRQMAGKEVKVAHCGGNPEGGLGTNVAAIKKCIEQVYGPRGVAILVDMGGAETNSEMAIEMLPREWKTNVVICRAPVVEGAVMAAAEASGGSSLQKVRATAEEYFR